QRLAELGFFSGTPNGSFGPRSRQALREFKSANGLVPDDQWSLNIQARLFDSSAQRRPGQQRGLEARDIEGTLPNPHAPGARETFVGTWVSDVAECRSAPGAGIRISVRQAEGYGAACSFGAVRRDGKLWRAKAFCSGNGATWDANISLEVSGDRLRWSSERGTASYVRCSNT